MNFVWRCFATQNISVCQLPFDCISFSLSYIETPYNISPALMLFFHYAAIYDMLTLHTSLSDNFLLIIPNLTTQVTFNALFVHIVSWQCYRWKSLIYKKCVHFPCTAVSICSFRIYTEYHRLVITHRNSSNDQSISSIMFAIFSFIEMIHINWSNHH